MGNVENTADLAKPISTATETALNGKITSNADIVASTHTKITYDAKGLVTAGSDLVSADIPDLSGTYLNLIQGSGNANKTVVTDATGNVILGTAQSPVVTTLNGVQTNTPSWYAPVANGTTGQMLYADANGAPTWGNAPQAVTVENVLNSTSATNALSANMGRVLEESKLNKAYLNDTPTADMVGKRYAIFSNTENSFFGMAGVRAIEGNYYWDSAHNIFPITPYAYNITYISGSIVSRHKKLYLSLQSNNIGNSPEMSPTHWECLTPPPAVHVYHELLEPGSKIYTINHNLETYYVVHSFQDTSSGNYIYPKVVCVDESNTRVEFNTALTDGVRVILIGMGGGMNQDERLHTWTQHKGRWNGRINETGHDARCDGCDAYRKCRVGGQEGDVFGNRCDHVLQNRDVVCVQRGVGRVCLET